MNTDAISRTANKQPPDQAALRSAGALYLLLTVTSIFGFFVPMSLITQGDAAATVNKILASETLFRLAIVSGLISTLSFIFLAFQLYRLLNHVNKTHASVMVILVLLSVPVSFLTTLNEMAALAVIHGGASLSGFATSQINSMAVLFLQLSSNVSSVNSIYFGLWLVPLGLLVIRSGFVPRILGILLFISAAAYVVSSLNFLISPPYANVISSITGAGFFGELGMVAWLVFRAAQIQFGGRPLA